MPSINVDQQGKKPKFEYYDKGSKINQQERM